MQCRTMSSQRPCGSSLCEREECKKVQATLVRSQTLEESHEALMRIYALVSGRPGYDTVTVKEILRAASGEGE